MENLWKTREGRVPGSTKRTGLGLDGKHGCLHWQGAGSTSAGVAQLLREIRVSVYAGMITWQHGDMPAQQGRCPPQVGSREPPGARTLLGTGGPRMKAEEAEAMRGGCEPAVPGRQQRDGHDAPVSASQACCQEQAASSRGALRVTGFHRAGWRDFVRSCLRAGFRQSAAGRTSGKGR